MKSLINSQTINLDQTRTTTPINIADINDVGVQIVVTTNANTGVFTLQVSNDNVNYSDITLDPAIAALAGANTVITAAAVDLPFLWFRVKFTIGTGTNGSAAITTFGKEI